MINKLIVEVNNLFQKEDIEATARDTLFVQRTSKIQGHIFLTVLIFGMNIYKTPTLEQLVGLLHLVIPELEITRQGLHNRINENAVAFFEAMLGKAINISLPTSYDIDVLSKFNQILILDSTAFQLPENLSHIFTGCGGSGSKAGIKIQFGYDLKTSKFFYVIHDGNIPDNNYKNSYIDAVQAGDLTIRDLGYFVIKTLHEINEKKAHYLSRLKLDTKVYQKNQNGELVELDLVKYIKTMPVDIEEIEVYLRSDKLLIKTRLVIEKVPNEVRDQRLRKINRSNQKKGKTTSEKTKLLQSVSLFISNAPSGLLLKENFRKLYGIRWQIELIFKNWKSNFSINQVTGIRECRVKCMIYVKLILIIINLRITFWIRNIVWIKSRREISEFRIAKQLLIYAKEWYRLILTEPMKVQNFLKDFVNFTIKHCIKIKQKNRFFPLEILEGI